MVIKNYDSNNMNDGAIYTSDFNNTSKLINTYKFIDMNEHNDYINQQYK
ncbi:27796_t:CDS:1, partial [Gigaspora margarita]